MTLEKILACPLCGDKGERHHKHLHVNEDKGVYYCHLCGEGGTVRSLVKKFPYLKDEIAVIQAVRYQPEYIENAGLPLQRLIDKTDNRLTVAVKNYLVERGLDDLMMRDVWWTPAYPARAVFPCRENGEIVFWAARAIGSAKPKWRFPKKGLTKISKSEAVFGLNKFFGKSVGELFIVEGVFDALAVDGVALLGKFCSDTQLRKILSLHPSRIVIGLDRDAKVEAEKLAEKVDKIVPATVEFPPKQYRDWGEIMEKG